MPVAAVSKPKARLATAPQLAVSSTLLQLPSVNSYWKAATGTPVIVIDQVSGAGLGHRVVGGRPVVGRGDPGPEDVVVPGQVSPLGVLAGTVTLTTAPESPQADGPPQLATVSLTMPPS